MHNFTFAMTGGKISGNTAKYGGGVDNYNGTFTMTGGTVTANNTFGVFNYGGTITLGKSAKITGNTSGNLFLSDYNTSISAIATGENAPVTEGADKMKIGVKVNTIITAGSSVAITKNGTEDYKKCFFSDFSNYYVNFNTNHLELKAPASGNYAINVIPSEHGTVTASKQEEAAEESITLTVAPDEGYQLKSLTAAYNDGEDKTCELTKGKDNTYTFEMPGYAVTVTAEFELIPKKKSSTTVTIGDRDDSKEETKAEEVKEEENPDTGAPVMSFGAVAVVLGAAYVLSKKH